MYKFSWIFVVALCACSSPEEETIDVPEFELTHDFSSEMNQGFIKEESFLIDQFIELSEWEMIKTGSGVRYMIYDSLSEPSLNIEPGMIAYVQFKISPLGGEIAYSSREDEVESILVEKDYVESGLHEALDYMRVGDKAMVILPHYMAHGLVGDMDKIPPLSAVVYDITLVDAKAPTGL